MPYYKTIKQARGCSHRTIKVHDSSKELALFKDIMKKDTLNKECRMHYKL